MINQRNYNIYKLIFLFIFSIIILNQVVANELLIKGTYQKDTNIVLTQGCNCTYVNIKNFISPNGTILFSNIAMINNNNGSFSYNLSKIYTQQSGLYVIEGYGNPDATYDTWSYGIKITNSGTNLNVSESIIYVILTIFIFLLLCVSVYLTWIIPYTDETDKLGFIIKVTRMKYLKMLFLGTSYGLLLWLLNLILGLSNNFTSLSSYSGLLGALTINLTRLSYIFMILLLIMVIYNFIRDLNLIKQIQQFGRVFKR